MTLTERIATHIYRRTVEVGWYPLITITHERDDPNTCYIGMENEPLSPYTKQTIKGELAQLVREGYLRKLPHEQPYDGKRTYWQAPDGRVYYASATNPAQDRRKEHIPLPDESATSGAADGLRESA